MPAATSRRPTLAMPKVVSSIFGAFPLVTYPSEQPPSSGTPSKPTLWLYGPPPQNNENGSNGKNASESLDPKCRQAQALARFTGLDCEYKWFQTAAGAPGQTLPSLHLPTGDLLLTDEISKHLTTSSTAKSSNDNPEATTSSVPGSPDPAADSTVQAFSALLQTALFPAVLAALYLNGSADSHSAAAVVPQRQLPIVTSVFMSLTSRQERSQRVAEIKKLRGGKEGARVVLDLEAVERDAVEALGAFEAKMRATEVDGPYFGGQSSPTAAIIRDRTEGKT
ncbi:hypothetical protein OIO90_000687 [Microbotryomycetes sp. JL221]|nr:hypothetical protein OIO90_000687 [Microbotryomycetes sp. JL221]